MKIYRDGQAIELTNDEVRNAFYEYQQYEQQERVRAILTEDGIEFTQDDVEEILSITNNELDDCDTYWDIEIDTIRNAIAEHFNLDDYEDEEE